jgi:hypothetical protein
LVLFRYVGRFITPGCRLGAPSEPKQGLIISVNPGFSQTSAPRTWAGNQFGHSLSHSVTHLLIDAIGFIIPHFHLAPNRKGIFLLNMGLITLVQGFKLSVAKFDEFLAANGLGPIEGYVPALIYLTRLQISPSSLRPEASIAK